VLTLKVRKIGDSLGIVLPEDAVRDMNLADGDTIYLARTANGYAWSTTDSETARQLELAEEGMNAYPNALRRLAE